MTKNRLLTTAALALVISAGAAQAQNTGASPQQAPAAQQNAPPSKMSPPMNAGERKAGTAETTGQNTQREDSGDATRMKDHTTPGSAQRSGSDAQGTRSGTSAQTGTKDNKSGMKAGADTKAGADVKTNAGNDTSSGAKSDANANGAKPAASTTGQGAAGATANLTTEQRSKITTVIRQQKVQSVSLNVDVRVGTRIPQSVRFYPLPAEVVTIYPQWRGYEYIVVSSTIVVIDPATREIVAVLEA